MSSSTIPSIPMRNAERVVAPRERSIRGPIVAQLPPDETVPVLEVPVELTSVGDRSGPWAGPDVTP